MKVLLIKEVPNLGAPGDVVEVKDGYARNYLLPKKLAVLPTPHNVERYRKLREQYEMELADRRTRAQALAEKLEGMELVFGRKVHDVDKLYAAVRPHDVAKELEERLGVKIEPSKIVMEPIELLGEYEVQVKLYEDIAATVKVKVEPID
ncbi:50S ribosomal protein L9 [Candidatus Bipolaricaulota sp. J31]